MCQNRRFHQCLCGVQIWDAFRGIVSDKEIHRGCVGHLRLNGAGVGAGGALLTRGSVGAWLRAVAHTALAVAASAAQHADAGHARVGACGAVAVLPLPAGVTLAEAAVALAVIWKEACGKGKVQCQFQSTWRYRRVHQNLFAELGVSLFRPRTQSLRSKQIQAGGKELHNCTSLSVSA